MMNRIQLLDTAAHELASTSPTALPEKLLPAANSSLAHRIFVPMHYEPNYSYPLLVWLHGPADDENQLKQIMPHVSLRNYLAVGPCGTHWLGEDEWGRSRGYDWQQTPVQIAEAITRVGECIDRVSASYNVARRRIFLAGYDHGGTMAMRVALAHPARYAGAISIGGPFPLDHTPLANIDQLRRLPLLIAHGRDSQQYPTGRLCTDLRLLHAAGMRVAVRQYPCEQEVTTAMLSDLNAWMMQIVTGVETPAQPAANYLPNQSLN